MGIALAAYQPRVEVFAEQLRSIQEQTWQSWVCVVTSDSPLQEFAGDARLRAFFKDERFVFFENGARLGHKKNFEKAIQAVVGLGVDAVACSDQDDRWYPHKLATSVLELEKVGPLSLVHSDMHVLVGTDLQAQTAWHIERRGVDHVATRQLLIRNVVSGCAMLMDVELARRFPIIPAAARFHDQWYALVASALGGVYPIVEPLYAYRQHGSNEVGVSPFAGRFAVRGRGDLREMGAKFQKGWIESRNLARALEDCGIELGAGDRRLFLDSRDMGSFLMVEAVRYFFRDPPLSRASAIRGMGKLISRWPGWR